MTIMNIMAKILREFSSLEYTFGLHYRGTLMVSMAIMDTVALRAVYMPNLYTRRQIQGILIFWRAGVS